MSHLFSKRPGVNAIVLVVVFVLASAAIFTILAPCSTADEPAQPSEPTVTIVAQNEPLGQVLEKIGRETHSTLTVSEGWQNHPVSIDLKGIPLSEGLNRILVNLNYAIIYESDTAIRISIYDAGDSSGAAIPERNYRAPAMPMPLPERIDEPEENEDEDASERSAPDDPPESSDR